MSEELEHLNELLKRHQANLRYYEKQRANYGAGEVPLSLHNSIVAEKKSIESTKLRISELATNSNIPITISNERLVQPTIRIGINQDSYRTYFYVPDGNLNRYPRLDTYKHYSYSIFLFELDVAAANISIHEIKAFVYHPSLQDWIELEEAIDILFDTEHLPDTMKYIERHIKTHHAFKLVKIDGGSTTMSFSKYGTHNKSIVHGYHFLLPIALVLHVNTSYLHMFCVIPEMGTNLEASVLDYTISERYEKEILRKWAYKTGYPMEGRKEGRRVITISEAML